VSSVILSVFTFFCRTVLSFSMGAYVLDRPPVAPTKSVFFLNSENEKREGKKM
jgi:hypothetical protein